MKVRVELFATLLPYGAALPAGSPPVLELPPAAVVEDVAALLGIPPEFARITLVNGRDAASNQMLRDGDVVSMFPPLAGGLGSRRRADHAAREQPKTQTSPHCGEFARGSGRPSR